MEVVKTLIEGVVIIEPRLFKDDRGYFFESFNQREFEEKVCKTTFVQDNESNSSYGVIRGLHFQKPPFAQSKLVRVIRGSVLDVAVDIRKGSPTFGQHVAVELTEDNHRQFFIPRGFAHGFSVLSKEVVFQYKCDNFYAPQCEGAIVWDDPDLGIDWKIPMDKILLSEKDKVHPRLKEIVCRLFNWYLCFCMSKELYTANNKRIAKNTLYLYFRMLLIMGVTLYTSRIVLNALGVEDFGIYNIVGGVVILFSFINNALSSATQRFLNFEIGRGDVLGTKRVFSMSLTIHLFVALFVVLLAETVGLWFLNTQMNIPTERMAAANLVYQFSILTVCISFVQIPYYASVVAYEKMSFFAYIAIIEVILKLLIVVLLIYVGFDKLRLYSILTFLVAVLVFACYKYYCNTRLDISRYKYFWDKILFSKLLNFSGWMLFGAAAGVSATQGVNILLNIFYGVTVNAAMGISTQVNSAVNKFVSNFQTAFMPQITKLYAIGDFEHLRKLIGQSSRFSFLLLFALACPLMLNIDFVLKLWLKTVPEYSSVFCILILIYSLVEAASKPVGLAIHATGKVKFYNIVMSIALLMNIIFSFIFLRLGFSPNVVLVINVCVGILCFAIRLLFAGYYKVLKIAEFIRSVIFRIVCISVFVVPVPLYISRYYNQWIGFFVTSSIFLCLFTVVVYFIGLTRSEKEGVLKAIKAKIFILKG